MTDGQTNIYDTGIDTALEASHVVTTHFLKWGDIRKRDKSMVDDFARRVMSGVRAVQESNPMDNMDDPTFVNRVHAAMRDADPGTVPYWFTNLHNVKYVHMVLETVHKRHVFGHVLDKPGLSYAEMHEASQAGTANDCGVLALAMVSGVSYNKALTTLRSAGKLDREGTTKGLQARALQKLGYDNRVLNLDYYLSKISDAGGAGIYLCAAQVKSHPEVFADKSDHCQLWFVPGHALAFTGGATVDDFKPDSRKRINLVMDIFPMGQHPPKDESVYRGRIVPSGRVRSGRYKGKNIFTTQIITPENAVLKPPPSVTKTIGTPVDPLPVRMPSRNSPGQFRLGF